MEPSALFSPALDAISAALDAAPGGILVTVDGRCSSGKTTFARYAAQRLGPCSVFHMDDFFLPPELRTPERLSTPGGNVDYQRAGAELFTPLSRGEEVQLRRFRCASMTLEPPVRVPFHRLSIIEGSYSQHPALAGFPQLRLFFTCSPQVQLARLARREAPESLEQFRQKWIPMEEAYFSAFDIQKRADVVVDSSGAMNNERMNNE